MYYLIKSISGIFVTAMDKQEMLSEIQKIESEKVKYPSSNTAYDVQQRLQFIIDVLNFLDTVFAKELYRVEKWKEKILQTLQNENSISGYSWTQTGASYVLLQVKELLMQGNTIPSHELPTCRHEVYIPTPPENDAEHKQQNNTEKIVEHAASAILHTGTLIFAQYTYNFYNEIVTKFESEQIVMHRQLTPYENQLLNWAKTERDHAIYARFDDAFKVVTHGAQSIVYAIDESHRY
ncbi:MAG: hypothetical protein IJ834_06670 [Paludibacteraceae bacterium]|nr:hypothetical protein [Paludibacteraceae bacterium]